MIENENKADFDEIKRLIPHRYPFLLIDKVENIISGKSATGIKNVTINEPHFEGHFPSKPIMPGVLIIESMAQTAAILVSKTLNIVMVDCEKNPELAEKAGVEGYPTFIYEEGDKKEVYNGERNEMGFLGYLKEKIGNLFG